MKNNKERYFLARLVTSALLPMLFAGLCLGSGAASPRETHDLSASWTFIGTDLFGEEYTETVVLPHSWNPGDIWDPLLRQPTGIDYRRGLGTYRKALVIDESWRGRRLFLKFGAANLVADVHINGQHLGQHRGGYSAFVFEITDAVEYGKANDLEVVVDNTRFEDIPPLAGDFNIYGGLIRPATLIVTHPVNITLTDFAGPGVSLRQQQVSAEAATVEALARIDNRTDSAQVVTVTTRALDDTGKLAASARGQVEVGPGKTREVSQLLEFDRPRLWQGTDDPFLYRVDVALEIGGVTVDEVTQHLGLRSIRIDPGRGLFLNDKPLKLHGVALHEDRAGSGAALSDAQREEDMRIMREMGVNALRLAHYPHGEKTLELADRAGMLVWSEIPIVGFPIGMPDGFRDTPEFKANARQQLVEMIRQRFNHPSVAFWGLYNELPEDDGGELDARAFILELQALAREEDPGRATTSAAFIKDPGHDLNNITDLQFWNRYFGWYYGEVDGLGPWLDEVHAHNPERPIGISEYGSGASVFQQREDLSRPHGIGDPVHEENWQAHQHEHAWRDIAQRGYLAGSFVWAMFDFSSVLRRESDNFGLNDKGLVTYDRRVRKDSYYFYKANWNPEPMLHIAGKRSRYRNSSSTDIKAYSNLAELELWVNGESQGRQPADDINRFIWKDVQLADGNNTLRVGGSYGGEWLEDRAIWSRSLTANAMVTVGWLMAQRGPIIAAILSALAFFYFRGFRWQATPGGTVVARIGFFAALGALFLYLGLLGYLLHLGLLNAFS